MIVVFLIVAFLFQTKSEEVNYSALIWLPPYIFVYREMSLYTVEGMLRKALKAPLQLTNQRF